MVLSTFYIIGYQVSLRYFMLDPVDQLTRDGIQFGAHQHQALQEAPVPNSLQDIRQLLSLCKSFKGHILDFAQVASALFTRTKRGSP